MKSHSRARHVTKRPLLQRLKNMSCHTKVSSKTKVSPDMVSDVPFPQSASPPIVLVHIGDRQVEIPFEKVLNGFWSGGLDSSCSVCNGSFNRETGPPIRTISSDHYVGSYQSHQFRVHNRHLDCMTRDHWKNIVPISHAWHNPVAKAHSSRESSDSAISLTLHIPSLVLGAVQHRFGSGIEIWHDYMSIPQWQHETQQSLLHLLPVVSNKAKRSIMHFDDVSTEVLRSITDMRRSMAPPLETLAAYMHSNWYQRMWVCLECASSQRAYVLSKDYSIHVYSFKGIEARMADHVGTYLSSHDRATFHTRCKELNFDHLSVRSLSNISSIKARSTLGAVYDIIARKQCHTYRDRFIATSAFLHNQCYKEAVITLPADTTEACLWVSRWSLERGDYAPLLLAPSLHSKESEVSGARWLRGYKDMTFLTWRLGRIVHEASSPIIMREGKIMAQLEIIGNITRWEYLSFAAVSQEEDFTILLDWVMATSNTSEIQFLATLPRIHHFHS